MNKPRVIKWKEIIKMRAEISEIEKKFLMWKINKTKSWFLENMKKIDKSLARLIKKKKKEKTQIKSEKKEKLQLTPHISNDHKRILQTIIHQ